MTTLGVSPNKTVSSFLRYLNLPVQTNDSCTGCDLALVQRERKRGHRLRQGSAGVVEQRTRSV